VHGFPREANNVVEVGGVRTLFRMPDLLSMGLGGGTIVLPEPLTVGPRSVGFRLPEKALVFGGDTLTATDVGVAAGLIDLGDRSRVKHLSPAFVKATLGRITEMLEEGIDRMKTQAEDVTLIAAGGGAFLIPQRLAGVAAVLHVEHASVANAVGAAIAQVSGEIDQVFTGVSRDAALAQAKTLAEQRAVYSGADPRTLKLVDVEDLPLAYLTGNAMRVRARVVGDIAAGPRSALANVAP
jgi:N-methylhydantoinase A/oxoprolinase/acetone carboxylase beta subunit